jgi:hypothetical protein
LQWQTQSTFWNDPRTNQSDDAVKRILYLNEMLEKLPDGFNNAANVTKSHIEAANIPARIQTSAISTTATQPRAKKGHPLGSKDTNPRQKKLVGQINAPVPTPVFANLRIKQDNEKISF